jgi:hypothetical protein
MGVTVAILLGLATLLGGLAALDQFYGKSKKWWRDRQSISTAHLPQDADTILHGDVQASPQKTVETLVSYLRNDQEKSGIHCGQFGRGQRLAEEGRYQTAKEAMDTKPRLYLTGWPVFILLNHSKIESREMLSAAKNGIQSLLTDSWVLISMGAHRYTSPVASGYSHRVISYRHTIRAAEVLLAIDNTNSTAKAILGRMLDQTAEMQTKAGGWRQCDTDFPDEDLWGSAYAAGFLLACLDRADALGLDENAVHKAKGSLERTLSWLHKRWGEDSWVYDHVPPEENAPLLFSEISDASVRYRPKLANAVLNALESYVDATRQPTSLYLDKNKIVGPCAAAARLAYCFFKTREFRETNNEKWRALLSYSTSHVQTGYNCVEASMLLDMILGA